MLELPEDDDSGDFFDTLSLPTSPPVVGTRKSKKEKKTKSTSVTKTAAKRPAAHASSSKPLVLPDDDDDGFEVHSLATTKSSPPLSTTCPKEPPNENLLDCDDSTLKLAAANIDSEVNHPFQDLNSLMAGPDPEPMTRCHAWELFSKPRCTPKIRSLNGRARRSYDLAHWWDLGEWGFLRLVIQDLLLLRPLFIIVSPPCTMLCQLQRSNWNRMNRQRRWLRLEEGLRLIDCAMWMAMVQISLGLFFVFEHPAGSLAWDRPSVA